MALGMPTFMLISGLLVGGAALRMDTPVKLFSHGPRTEVERKIFKMHDVSGAGTPGSKWKELVVPEWVRHHNLVIMGDSVDRSALINLCKWDHGTAMPYPGGFDATTGPDGAKVNYEPIHHHADGQTLADICDFPQYDMTVMYLWHQGVTSLEPEPQWHVEPLLTNRTDTSRTALRHPELAHNNKLYMLPRRSSGQVVYSAMDLTKIYWPGWIKTVFKWKTKERPVLLVAQSHLWDFGRAREYLSDHNLDFNTHQTGLESVGWKNLPGIKAFDWEEKATAWVQGIKDSGIPYERFFWRTNSNCPAYSNMEKDEVPFLQALQEEAAEVARRRVKEQEGAWKGLELVDWRADFDASVYNDCHKSLTLHYGSLGYRAYWESMFASMKPKQ